MASIDVDLCLRNWALRQEDEDDADSGGGGGGSASSLLLAVNGNSGSFL